MPEYWAFSSLHPSSGTTSSWSQSLSQWHSSLSFWCAFSKGRKSVLQCAESQRKYFCRWFCSTHSVSLSPSVSLSFPLPLSPTSFAWFCVCCSSWECGVTFFITKEVDGDNILISSKTLSLPESMCPWLWCTEWPWECHWQRRPSRNPHCGASQCVRFSWRITVSICPSKRVTTITEPQSCTSLIWWFFWFGFLAKRSPSKPISLN